MSSLHAHLISSPTTSQMNMPACASSTLCESMLLDLSLPHEA